MPNVWGGVAWEDVAALWVLLRWHCRNQPHTLCGGSFAVGARCSDVLYGVNKRTIWIGVQSLEGR